MTAALAALNERTFASLRKHRNYRLYFAGQIVSLSGTWMQDTALPWLVLQKTDSPIAVGLLVFCRYVPFTLFGLYAGLVADRVDNRRFLILTQSVSMVIAATLAVLVASGNDPLWVIYVLAFVGGAAVVFDAPSRHALTFQLVGRDELPNAVALNSSLFNAARIVGPATAGVLIAVVGVATCFAINAVSFLAVLTVLVMMRTAELYPLDRHENGRTGWSAIREGLGYVRHEPRLRLIILVTAVVGLVGFNFRVLLPVLAENTLDAGADVFGVLFACFGVGALAGALIAAGAARPRWRRFLVGVVGFSTAMLLLAPVQSVWLAAGLLFVIGMMFSLWTATSQSILQLTAPDRLRGRVVSIYLFVFAGLTPVGSLLAGWLADVGGTELAFAVAGAAGLAVAGFAFIRVRSVKALPDRARPGDGLEPAEMPPV